jgi:hypothetical protein
MKILINKSYGGFRLSAKAIKMYCELKNKPCYFFEFKNSEGNTEYIPIEIKDINEESMHIVAFTVTNPIELAGSQDRFGEWSLEQRQESNKKWDEISIDDYKFIRNDPDLIKVVETLGYEDSSVPYCELKIVEIPDDVDWIIEEYDGSEWVSEVHRTWS